MKNRFGLDPRMRRNTWRGDTLFALLQILAFLLPVMSLVSADMHFSGEGLIRLDGGPKPFVDSQYYYDVRLAGDTIVVVKKLYGQGSDTYKMKVSDLEECKSSGYAVILIARNEQQLIRREYSGQTSITARVYFSNGDPEKSASIAAAITQVIPRRQVAPPAEERREPVIEERPLPAEIKMSALRSSSTPIEPAENKSVATKEEPSPNRQTEPEQPIVNEPKPPRRVSPEQRQKKLDKLTDEDIPGNVVYVSVQNGIHSARTDVKNLLVTVYYLRGDEVLTVTGVTNDAGEVELKIPDYTLRDSMSAIVEVGYISDTWRSGEVRVDRGREHVQMTYDGHNGNWQDEPSPFGR